MGEWAGLARLTLATPIIFWYLKKQDVGGTIKHAPFYVKFLCLSIIFAFWMGLVLSYFSITNWDNTYSSLFLILLPLLIFILISKIEIIFNNKTIKYTINDKDQSVMDAAKYLLFVIERPLLIVWGVFVGLMGALFVIIHMLDILYEGIGNVETKMQIFDIIFISNLFIFWIGLKPANESERTQERPQSELLMRVKLKVAEKLNPQSEFLIDAIHWCCILLIIWTPLFALPALFCSFMTFRHSHPKRIPTLIVCLICIVLSLLIYSVGGQTSPLAPLPL